MGSSTINEFHRAVGQFNDYSVALEFKDPLRVLFLAVPLDIWIRFFQKPLIQRSLERIEAKILVYDPFEKSIVQWIK